MRKKPYKRVRIEKIRELYNQALSEGKIFYGKSINQILESSKDNPILYGKKFHLKTWHRKQGSYRRNRGIYSLSDDSPQLKNFLDAVKISYTEGNDASRGGVEGDYIQILTKIIY